MKLQARGDENDPYILIVDDDKTNISILSSALRRHYRIEVVTSGQQVLESIKTNMPDLVLLDIMMPNMDGYEVCARLQKDARTKDTPIIFVTSMIHAKDKARGLELGAVDYITKPFDVVEVKARVRAHLALKQARDELKSKELRLRSFINTLTTFSDALVLLDANMTFRFINPAAEKIFESLRDQSSFFQTLDPTMLTEPKEIELEKASGESIHVEIRVMETEWEGETAYLAAIRDISARKKAEMEAEIHRQQLIEADKLASIGILASGVAHEINNPNGVISLNAPMLRRAWTDADTILEEYYHANGDFSLGGIRYSKLREKVPLLLDQIVESSKRIKRIVEELKDYARKEVSGLSGNIQINDVVQSAVSLVSNTIRKATQAFSVRYAPDLPQVKGNFQRLEQVVVNLLINSCQALMGENRKLSVSTSWDKDTDWLFVTVQDEGCGISEFDMKHIFDPFFTTKRGIGGTGLGLSISRGIAEEHGGRLELTSVLGRETTAVLSLPVHKEEVGSAGK